MLPPSSIQKCGAKGRAIGHGNQLWLQSQHHAHSGQSNRGGEEEAGRGAVDQVPEYRVRKGKGQGGLGSRLPRETSLERLDVSSRSITIGPG
jgi:hypothetical protein